MKGKTMAGKTLQTSYVRIAPSFEGSGDKLKREINSALKEAFSDLQSTLDNVNKVTSSSAGKIADNIGDELSGIKVDTSKGLDGVKDQISEVGQEAGAKAKKAGFNIAENLNKAINSKAGKGIKKVGGGLTKAFGGAMIAGVGAVGVGAGIALSKGFSRTINIEEAKAKLKGLKYSGEEIDGVMNSVTDSVTGTAFALDEMAGVSATALASGVKQGQPLTDYLSKIADTATITGSSVGEIGSIFNKVTAGGKVSAEELNQLQDRGLGIGQMLAKQLGVSQQEVKKLSSQGKISSKDFLAAFSAIDGAAQNSGDTVKGSYNNMLAALGRIGVSALSGIMPMIQPLLKSVTNGLDFLNNNVLKPAADTMAKTITPKLVSMAQQAGPAMIGFFKKAQPFIKGFIKNLMDSFGKLMDNMGDLKKNFGKSGGLVSKDFVKTVSSLAKSFTDLLAEIVPIIAIIGTSTFLTFFTLLSVGATILESILPYVVDFLEWLQKYPGILTGLTTGLLAAYGALQLLTVISTVIGAIKALKNVTILSTLAQWGFNASLLANPITWIVIGVIALIAAIVLLVKNWDVVSEVVGNFFSSIVGWLGTAVSAIGGFFVFLWESFTTGFMAITMAIGSFLMGVLSSIGGFFASIGTAIGGFVMGVIGGVKNMWEGVISWAQGAISTVVGWITSIWTTITTISSDTWTAITSGVSSSLSAIGGFFSSMWDKIKGIWEGIKTGTSQFIGWISSGLSSAINAFGNVFSSLWGNIKNIFSGLKDSIGGIWDGFINVGKTAIQGMLAPVNGLIDMLNHAFIQLNRIRIKLPNGGHFGVNIPLVRHVKLPGLAEGGIVGARSGGTPVILGEGGRDEAVTDVGLLNKLISQTNARFDNEGGGSQGPTNVEINLTLPEGANIKEWADKLQSYWEYTA